MLRVSYATDPTERKILLYLCSAEGQVTFCDVRTGPHITLNQLLHAFPSSKPPVDNGLVDCLDEALTCREKQAIMAKGSLLTAELLREVYHGIIQLAYIAR